MQLKNLRLTENSHKQKKIKFVLVSSIPLKRNFVCDRIISFEKYFFEFRDALKANEQ